MGSKGCSGFVHACVRTAIEAYDYVQCPSSVGAAHTPSDAKRNLLSKLTKLQMFSSERVKKGISSCLPVRASLFSVYGVCAMGFCIWLQDRLSGSIELALAMLCRSRQDYMDAERAKGRNFDDIYSEVSQSGLLPVTFSGLLPLLYFGSCLQSVRILFVTWLCLSSLLHLRVCVHSCR